MSKKRRAKIPPFRVLNSENIFRKFVSKIMRSCDKNFAQLHLQNDIVERIRTVLEETKMRPENLTLEVTESLAINDIGRMKKVLSKIKELGALIALDDFGTGSSSLSHIRELPIDIIKIDRCFVIDLGKDDYAETFVRMVAELADTIGVRMCVEGVEYDEQLQILKDMKKVQYIQGYYYDKPLTEEAFEKKYL